MYKIKAGIIALIVLLIFIGCENNTMSYNNEVNNLNRKSLLRPDNKLDELFPEQIAAKFIEKAQDRIEKVTEKANEKSDKVDISTVEEILLLANKTLQDAKDAFTTEDYELALELAKEAKNIANEAMEELEDLVEEYESTDNGDEEDDEEDDSEIAVDDLPQAIIDYINANYPGNVIVSAELEDNGNIEVLLDNGLELLFDSEGNFLEEEDDSEDEEEEEEEEEEEYTDDNVDFELEYEIGETTSVEIESNIVLTQDILNLINQVATLITNNAQDDVKIKLKIELKDGELELEFYVDGALTPEQENILNQIKNAIIDIYYNTNYEDFEVEIEIEFELEEEEDEDDDNEDDDDNNGNNEDADKALKFIDQAQNKIDKATDKADKKNSSDIDLTDVYTKIKEAEEKIKEAQDAYDNGDYGYAIDLAKEAKELANEALDILEDILDAADDDDGNDDDDDDEENDDD